MRERETGSRGGRKEATGKIGRDREGKEKAGKRM